MKIAHQIKGTLQSATHIKIGHRPPHVVRKELTHLGTQFVFIQLRRHLTYPHDCIAETLRVGADCGEKHVFDLFAQTFIDVPNHSAGDHSDDIMRHSKQVSWMRVGVVETVTKDHLQIEIPSPSGEFIQVGTGCFKRLMIRDWNHVEMFHRQYLLRTKLRINRGKVDGFIISEIFRKPFKVTAFIGKIQFPEQRSLKITRRGKRLIAS